MNASVFRVMADAEATRVSLREFPSWMSARLAKRCAVAPPKLSLLPLLTRRASLFCVSQTPERVPRDLLRHEANHAYFPAHTTGRLAAVRTGASGRAIE